MASLQAAKSSSQINGKAQATTRASILNNGMPGGIKFQEKKDWSGSVVGSYPSTIQKSRTGTFSHKGVPPKDSNGSMGAVVYVGGNVQGGPDNCAWIMAWSTPGDGSGNKIYVETGPSTKYPPGSVDWDDIKSSLENSSDDSHYYDEDSHTEASAQINNGNTPKAPAVFDVTV